MVPSSANTIMVTMAGACGGNGVDHSTLHSGGNGGLVNATLSVSPGSNYTVYVGGMGGSQTTSGIAISTAGGFNGGGRTASAGSPRGSGGGGGASDIRSTASLLSRILIAAGGGGGGSISSGGSGGCYSTGWGCSGTSKWWFRGNIYCCWWKWKL